ncbi:MAG: DUF4105 domain-containing protein [Bacteroidales bacterium]|nr:DUF4105 domain-containing protein [Bacteroidales bacterium]
MKRTFLLITVLLLLSISRLIAQSGNDTLVYLLTCGTGTETYSIYGHSALRVVIPASRLDKVYNWGVFDFDTPNFAWKFAKGRLDYMVAEESMQGFLQVYFSEKRYVQCQKLNISPAETAKLIAMLRENLRPENIKYRYDFFYDDCSTRIRDLIEKAVGDKLLYPPDEGGKSPTFRMMVGKYQDNVPWLNLGIDLLMGITSDREASFRDRMFLPIDMQMELSETVVNRDGKMVPLLQNPDLILDFDPPSMKQTLLTLPAFVFTAILILVLIFTAMVKKNHLIKWFDIFIYTIFSVLAGLMIFFNFFTDHQQMRMNLNILWLNPVIIISLVLIIFNKNGTIWFRLLFYILAAFLAIHILLPQSFNIAILPLVLILLIRSSVRADFEWNPLSLKQA